MTIWKVQLELGMRPWMVEKVFGRNLPPGYIKDFKRMARQRMWIKFDPSRNGEAFDIFSRQFGAAVHYKPLTEAVQRLMGTEKPKVEKTPERDL